MKQTMIVLGALAIAGCGADGEPVRPSAQSSINISNHGVGVGTSVRLGNLPVSINLGTHL